MSESHEDSLAAFKRMMYRWAGHGEVCGYCQHDDDKCICASEASQKEASNK